MPIMNSASLVKKTEQHRASTLIEVTGFSILNNNTTTNLNNNHGKAVLNQENSVKISSKEDAEEEQEVDIEGNMDEEEKIESSSNNNRQQNTNRIEEDEEEEEEESDGNEGEESNEEEDDEDDDDEEEGEEEEDRQSNDQSHSHDSSNVNSTEAEYPVTFSRKSKYNFDLNDNILYQDVLQINCNSIVAELHKKKFGSGGKGHCVRCQVSVNQENEIVADTDSTNSRRVEKWMTPIEFENYCGKGNCRDWKRTIKVGGQPLLALLDARILICHAVSCSCGICNRNETLVGPIRPFMKYRRRKRDEILAQNAYKKFLSLKPPTLLHDTLSKFSSPSFANNNSNNISVTANQNNNNSNSSTASSNNSLPTMSASPIVSFTNTNTAPTILNVPASVSLSGLGNFNSAVQSITADQDLQTLVQRMQENEEKRWSSLEQIAVGVLNDAKHLHSTIENSRQESNANWNILLEKLKRNSCTQFKRSSTPGLANINISTSGPIKRKLISKVIVADSISITKCTPQQPSEHPT